MSWLARSIANSLKLNDDDDGEEESDSISASMRGHSSDTSKEESMQNRTQSDDPSPPSSPSRGVREDLSEITKTLSRQFWGVASFLAPPPQSESPNESQPDTDRESEADTGGSEAVGPAGIRNDFAELGGKFRSGIYKLSSNMAVSEITKIASNILQLGSDDEEEDGGFTKGAVGVTEEVVAFARDIAMHPETWLDFPLPENEEDEDFDMSDAQQDHALAVEHLAPRLAALRLELCPGHMSETHFWKIYFILVQPRLDKDDAELLSTPQIAKARAFLGHELRKRTDASSQDGNKIANEECLSVPPDDVSVKFVQVTSGLESTPDADKLPNAASANFQMVDKVVTSDADKLPSANIQTVDKTVIEDCNGNATADEALPSTNLNILNEEDDADDWLKEESSEMQFDNKAPTHIENEDDVSFSDLEDEDDRNVTIS
ncbi:unnamed protein product [Cuscuta campestris]|uniref:BSD domain-containing protein n=1 Tax=Cuscuta campestris TaxID=132261 RepID=A0A484NF25_9ASTE|nr:unnamed protein product [Cuscuta campestris]